MSSQRITIAKIGGVSASVVLSRILKWSSTRKIDDPTEWRSDQWPLSVRREIDDFAYALRTNGHQPPVIYFGEHIDLWSMGDLFDQHLTPDGGKLPIQLHADRYQLWCYSLPDDGVLAKHLQDFFWLEGFFHEGSSRESHWFATKLFEAVNAWNELVDTAAIVLLREVLEGLVTDSDLKESLVNVPEWIAKSCDSP